MTGERRRLPQQMKRRRCSMVLRCVAVLVAGAAVPIARAAAAVAPARATTIVHGSAGWVLENDRLRVRVDPGPGSIQVLDKVSGYTWRQPTRSAASAAVPIPRRLVPASLNADPSTWTSKPTVRLTHAMTTTDGPRVDGDRDCSADVWCSWDDQNFYLDARVTDDILQFGPADNPTWWEKDSLEFWVGRTQVGLSLNPGGSQARTTEGPVAGARVALRVQPGGYAVEAAIPW
ncbi:MAG: hypothetical protein LC772_10575, partial [Chloroflexi bacterium]|nr:hypothetical protein [Chloroflexota bacterium]